MWWVLTALLYLCYELLHLYSFLTIFRSIQNHKMFSFLVNAVTAFKRRKSQRKTASIGTAASSTPTTIKIYKEDINRIHGQFTSPELNPTRTPRVGRTGHIIKNINVLTQYQIPIIVEPMSVDMRKGGVQCFPSCREKFSTSSTWTSSHPAILNF